MSRIFEVNYAGIPVRYQFRNGRTAPYFARGIHLSESEIYDIKMNDEEFAFFRSIHPDDVPDEYVEYKGLIYLTSRWLLSNQCCVFHATSFYWKNKAWLLTGKSGIGKTTQFMNWNRIFPDEIVMISGDMPVLDFRSDKIFVHPSPWNGKEGMYGNDSAELGGIVILKQKEYNTVEYAEMRYSIQLLYRQFAFYPKNEEEIHSIAGMVQRMIEEVPIWISANDGSEDSTRLLRDTLLVYLEKENRI